MTLNQSGSGKNISVLGASLISCSFLFFSFVEYRPNRVLSGINIKAQDLFGKNFYWMLLCSILLLVLIIINHKKYRLFIGFTLISLMGLVLYLLGIISNQEYFQQIPNSRISLGLGFWSIFLGIHMVMSGCCKGEQKDTIYKRLFYIITFLLILAFLLSGHLNNLSLMKEFLNRKTSFSQQINRHFLLSFLSVIFGLFIGIPLGILIHKKHSINSPLLFLINLGQTIPTLSLLGLIMVLLTLTSEQSSFLKRIGVSGVGFSPAFIVLIIYALFPIIHNTIAALKIIDPDLIETATGLGMKSRQVFWKVQFPLSLPIIIGGIRIAMTQSIGNSILAGLIGGGGLGSIIFLGLAQAAPDLILLGVIPLVVMAFLFDSFFSFIIFYYKKRLGLFL